MSIEPASSVSREFSTRDAPEAGQFPLATLIAFRLQGLRRDLEGVGGKPFRVVAVRWGFSKLIWLSRQRRRIDVRQRLAARRNAI